MIVQAPGPDGLGRVLDPAASKHVDLYALLVTNVGPGIKNARVGRVSRTRTP